MEADGPVETVEGEVILSELEGGDPDSIRTLRVYDKSRGDFVIEIPGDCRVTFGYFNPAASGDNSNRYGMHGGPGGQTMKTTCLRVYEGKGDKNQIAAFLGVDGFRDHKITMKRLSQKVTIETNFEDDGEGKINYGGRQVKQPLQITEGDEF